MRKTLYFVLLLHLIACEAKEKIKELSYDIKKNHIILNLDSTTPPYTKKLIYDENTNQIIWYNHIKNSLYIYNLTTKELDDTIQISTDEKDNIKNLNNLLYVNKDSIYLLDKNRNLISYINKKVSEKISLSDIMQNSLGGSNCELSLINGKIIGCQFEEMNDNQKPIWIYDISKKKKESVEQLPSDYIGKLYTNHLTLNYGTYNSISKEYIVSYIASKKILVFNTNQSIKTIELYCPEIATIRPIANQFNELLEMSDEEIFARSYAQANFGRMLHDPYRNIYYRFASPEKNYDEFLHNSNMRDPFTWCFIYNENFAYLGHIKINEEILSATAFVSKDGLMIMRSNTEEEKAIFDLYNINL